MRSRLAAIRDPDAAYEAKRRVVRRRILGLLDIWRPTTLLKLGETYCRKYIIKSPDELKYSIEVQLDFAFKTVMPEIRKLKETGQILEDKSGGYRKKPCTSSTTTNLSWTNTTTSTTTYLSTFDATKTSSNYS